MNKLAGLALIAAPFIGFGLMVGHETHMGPVLVFLIALAAAGSIIFGTEIIDNDRLP